VPERLDAAAGEGGREKAAEGLNLVGRFLALSVALHAAFFAGFLLWEGKALPGLPERQALHISWVSISRDAVGAAGMKPSPAERPVRNVGRLLPPSAIEKEEVPVRLFSEPVPLRTGLEREANQLPAMAAPGPNGSHSPVSVRESAPAEEAQGGTIAKQPSASGLPDAESPRAASGVKPPRYLENSRPDYPVIARLRGYEGVVWLSVEVSPDGRVGDLRIKKSSGFDVLDQSAVRAVKTWRFEPARSMGAPVSMWVDLPVRFVLTDGSLPS